MSDAATSLTEHDTGTLVQLAGWARSDAGADSALEVALAELGFEDADEVGMARSAGERTLYRTAPGRAWVRGGEAAPVMRRTGPELAALDLTQSRRCLRLSHPELPEVASTFLSHDFRPRAWPVGAVRQTGIHGTAVLTHRTGAATLDILVPSTWARTTRDYLAAVLDGYAPV